VSVVLKSRISSGVALNLLQASPYPTLSRFGIARGHVSLSHSLFLGLLTNNDEYPDAIAMVDVIFGVSIKLLNDVLARLGMPHHSLAADRQGRLRLRSATLFGPPLSCWVFEVCFFASPHFFSLRTTSKRYLSDVFLILMAGSNTRTSSPDHPIARNSTESVSISI
jgi:hypothetical protein